MFKSFFAGLTALALLSACGKDEVKPDASRQAPLTIQFDNIVGDRNLQLGTGTYTTAQGESFSVSQLQYFISNVRLTATDGSTYTVPQDSSYFLVRESDAASQFARVRVPEGDYARLTFTVGVDSLRSAAPIGQRTGVLDPGTGGMDDGMYWGWNSGYIFLKLEGTSASAPVDPSGQRKFRYHVGGFGGYSAPTINNIKHVTIDLQAGGVARVRQGRTSNVHLLVDILRVFNGPTPVSIAANPTVMFSQYSTTLATNYAGMFAHDHTEN